MNMQKNKALKKFRLIISQAMTHLVVLSLAYGPILPMGSVKAQQPLPGDAPQQERTIQNTGINDIMGIIQGIGGQISQHRQQMAAMQQQQQLRQNMCPKAQPDEMFGACMLPTPPMVPEDACLDADGPHQIPLFETLREGALVQKNYFERMLNEGKSNAPMTFPGCRPIHQNSGVKCLEAQKNTVMRQLQNRINGLQALIDQIDKRNQLFRDQSQELLRSMQDDHAMITGTRQGRGDLDSQSQNYADLFSRDCQNILVRENVGEINQMMMSGGLLGLQENLSGDRGNANDFINNRSSIINDVNQSIEHIQNVFQTHGIEPAGEENPIDFLGRQAQMDSATQSLVGTDRNSPLINTVASDLVELTESKARTQQVIRDMGINYRIPRMDGNFGVDFAHFQAGAKDYFRKQYVNNCVTGQADTGLGMSAADVLSSLRHDRFNDSNAPVVNNYREALQNILDSDAYIEDKIVEIQRLHDSIGDGNIKVHFRNSQAQEESVPPYVLYQRTIASCRQQFEQDETFSTTGSGQAMAKNVERVENELAQLKNRHDTFLSELGNNISDRLLNCNGRELQSGPQACGPDMMQPTNQNFCVKHATQCANMVNGCYSEVEHVTNQKRASIQSTADEYNLKVQAFVADQEQFLATIKNRLIQDQQMMQNFFPEANFDLAEGLFIPMPEMVDEFGVEIRGGSSFAETGLAELSQKVAALKNQFSEQANRVANNIDKFMDLQRDNMYMAMSKMEQMGQRCRGAADALKNQAMEQYRAQQEQYQERAQNVGDFCNRFDRLGSMHPNAACDGFVKDLFNSSMDASGNISGDALAVVNEYNNLCARTQTESQRNRDRNNVPEEILDVCSTFSSWDAGIDRILGAIAENIDGVSRSQLLSYYRNGGSANISQDVIHDNQRLFNTIANLKEQTENKRSATSFNRLITQVCDGDSECLSTLEDGEYRTMRDNYESEDGHDFCGIIDIEAAVTGVANDRSIRASRAPLIRSQYSRGNELVAELNRHLTSNDGRRVASIEREWNTLGEHAQSVSCHAQATPQRGMQGFLQSFDAMTGGNHAVGGGLGSGLNGAGSSGR